MAGPISRSGTSKNSVSAAAEEAAGCQLSPAGGETPKPRLGWHRFTPLTILRDPRRAEATSPSPLRGHREGICRTGDVLEGKAAPRLGQTEMSSAWRRRTCLSRDAPTLSPCSQEVPARHARLWEEKKKKARHAEFTPRLPPRRFASPKFLAGLAIWHFLPVPTARSGNGVKNISHARTLTVKTPTGALSAVPPLLCLLRGGVPQCRQSLCCLPI